MQPPEHVHHIDFADALLKYPVQDLSTEYVHDGKQIIPPAFALDPHIFDVQAQVLHRLACQNFPVLYPVPFATASNHLSKKKPGLIHEAVGLLLVNQIAKFPELVIDRLVAVSIVRSAHQCPDLLNDRIVRNQCALMQRVGTGSHSTDTRMWLVVESAAR